jgi:hypothetical protein
MAPAVSRFLWTDEAIAQATKDYTTRHFTVGLDLGQSVDPTAVAIIEKVRTPVLTRGKVPDRIPYVVTYGCRHLERLPLRMTYPDIVLHVRQMMATAPLTGDSKLVIDASGVGRPIFDLFKEAGLRPAGVVITGGDGWSEDCGMFRVSKQLLVSQLTRATHSGAICIAAELPEAHALRAELSDFRMNTTMSGSATFGARSGRHDDLVLALAVGLWHATLNRSQTEGIFRL